jgi:hypothetical protein
MPPVLDHVFVCCDRGAPEAEALVAAGLVEGARNVHEGQGTANRRFFFEDGYLELLWVEDEAEARSEPAAQTRLHERWAGRHDGGCPFGIAFSTVEGGAFDPPFATWPYRPAYLPPDQAILFAQGTSLAEPELFCLPWPRRRDGAAAPPRHPAGLERLVAVSVGLPDGCVPSQASRRAQAAGLVAFHRSARHELVLTLRARGDATFDLRPGLPLVLRGTEGGAW